MIGRNHASKTRGRSVALVPAILGKSTAQIIATIGQ